MLEVKFISKKFGNTVALSDVSFSTSHGGITIVLGPSGSGKTTLLEIIAGIIRPDKGLIKIGGEVVECRLEGLSEIHIPPHKRRIGYLPQDYALFPHLTVYENIAFGLRALHLSELQIKKRVNELLELTNLIGLEDRFPNQLSGGQRQRVALARALAIEPQVLLLDEPLSNLDANLRAKIRFELKAILSRLRMPTIYVTHNLTEAYVLDGQVIILMQGRIIGKGKLDEILDNPENAEVADFLGLNVKTATIIDVEDKHVKVSINECELKCLVNNSTSNLKKGQQVYVAFRPDAVWLSTSKPSDLAENILTGKLINATFSRELVKILLDVGFTFSAVLSRREWEILNLTSKKEIYVTLKPETIRLIRR
jgi:ABC-type Fe3+/spermidine/putrescine transport system ATPase subunit